MLIEFKVANFRSIREEQTFSLVAANADKELPESVIEQELPGLSGVRFLKGAAIYGPNASGKSNVIKAIEFAAKFVRRSATKLQPGDPTGAEPFKLDSASVHEPSSFEMTFVAENTRFVFGFSITPQRVVEEYLVAYPKGAPQRWFHRTFDVEKGVYNWAKPSSAFKRDKSLEAKTRDNCLFLSVGPQFNHAQLTKVFHWFQTGVRFLHLSTDNRFMPGFTTNLISEGRHVDQITSLLASADTGVTGVDLRQEDVSVDDLRKNIPPALLSELENEGPLQPGKRMEIKLLHKTGSGGSIELDFNKEESAGTKRLFALAGPWADILEQGYTVFVDEIETSLHPVLVKELLKLVFQTATNPKAAQVVFSTHNAILLDGSLLRRDQVWFTEKSPAGVTHLYPLTDYQPRNTEALAKGYLAGRYGAIPFLPEGLKL